METLEVHAKDYLVKWVNAPENSSIAWQVKPLKKSINFAIYKRNDSHKLPDDASKENEPPQAIPLGHKSPSTESFSQTRLRLDSQISFNNLRDFQSVVTVNQINSSKPHRSKSRSSTFSSNLSNSDLLLLKNYYKLLPGELVKGSFECPKEGSYAFIFDNSFSKTMGKNILFSAKIVTLPDSPMKRRPTYSAPSLSKVGGISTNNILHPKNGELMQSVLLKKRRKKLQGFTKRFFILNFKYGTLSYFKNNDNKLRGQMPIVDSIISADSKSREIIVDSGMEVWDLKALNNADFEAWVSAFNLVKKQFLESPVTEALDSDSYIHPDSGPTLGDIQQQLSLILSDFSSVSKDELESKLYTIHLSVSDILRKQRNTELNSIYSGNEFFDAHENFDAIESSVIMRDEALDKIFEPLTEAEESFLDLSSSDVDSDVLDLPEHTLADLEPARDADAEVDLYPLPLESVERGCDIPEFSHDPPSLLGFVRKNVGKDLSSLSMPVDMNEPLTILQRYAENFEYAEMIDKALQGKYPEDSGELILRIAAYSVTFLSVLRTKGRQGYRYLCEKVSHKPPVFAILVESKDWTLSFSPSPSQKFWGKTSEVFTDGTAKLTIRESNLSFTWLQPTCILKNIIAGEKYTEPSSSMTIKCSNGQKAVVEFAKGGMFSGRSEDLTIKAFDSSKKPLAYSVSGKWTESLTLKTNSTEKVIWTAGKLLPNSAKKFGFTEFAGSLNKITSIEEGKLAPTDSRLRPDMDVYAKGNVPEAETLKRELEENQRVRRKEMEVSGTTYKPKFFKQVGGDPASPETGEWIYIEGELSYWERRKVQNWDGLDKLW